MCERRYLVSLNRAHGNGRDADALQEQTALVGKVADEFNCMPVENAEYQRISEAKALKALEPKEKVRLIDLRQHKGPNVREVAAGAVGGFVVSLISRYLWKSH